MNKITIILLTGILCCAIPGFAQDENPTRLGVKGGVNFSNFRVDKIADNNMKAGLNLGLFAKLPVGAMFSIQPELLYSSKGAKLKYDNFIQGEGEYRFNMNYLELPVLAVFNIGKYFNIHAGPYAAFLTSSNIKDMDDDGTIEGVKDIDVDNFNRFDYGVAAGIGIDVNGFIAGARYNYGLQEIGEEGNLTGELTSDSKNSVATIYIGFGF
ncbi:MAG TPA: porin family protein [Ohtaekwangia sp.]|nr:porin family protein [Ohtaekwangia sp.]